MGSISPLGYFAVDQWAPGKQQETRAITQLREESVIGPVFRYFQKATT